MSRCAFENIQATDVRGALLADHGPPEERVRQIAFAILEQNVLCSMATVTPDGRAHINTAYFSHSENLEIYFLSHPGSLHCRSLSSNPFMAMTVFCSAQRWTDPGQGMQLFGTCGEASGSAAKEAERWYRRRFEAYENWKAALKSDDRAREYRFYRFEVAAVKILDEKSFGDAVFIRASVIRQ